ncbi:hypothetical protein N7449_005401 [Penicillium cf. viridicatum]|uniref:Uncharacterized protein n=1 Tax=Penicillium cf. viridicatum TaxID=2972119 RepID=A0A9W9ML84_9EURO|nr:hypothetical protein N7449_005401 [Penicillium cf. viridicatum]
MKVSVLSLIAPMVAILASTVVGENHYWCACQQSSGSSTLVDDYQDVTQVGVEVSVSGNYLGLRNSQHFRDSVIRVPAIFTAMTSTTAALAKQGLVILPAIEALCDESAIGERSVVSYLGQVL